MTVIANTQNSINHKIDESIEVLSNYYLNDTRAFCVAYSGGKDSTAVVYLVIKMLRHLQSQNLPIDKTVYFINSNTLAELPPMLKHLRTSLQAIYNYGVEHDLPIKVKEVSPEDQHTLNVQLLGVGMPPPSPSFRWCTDKLKVKPIDAYINDMFKDGQFISIIGSRRDESAQRSHSLDKRATVTKFVKSNDRYPQAINLMPIEYWTTKNVWEFLFTEENSIINTTNLWNLYSDASSKNASECVFTAAGGQEITEGNLGCGVSRFGCWQCYVTRDNDKSLDGLLNSKKYSDLDLYKNYRDYYWNMTQEGWHKTRDVYSHKHQGQELYNKSKTSPLYGATMPKGLKLPLRINAFKAFMELQSKIDEEIITLNEIILIQKRWFFEGDLTLSAFSIARKHGFKIDNIYKKELLEKARYAKAFYKEQLNKPEIKKHFAILTLKRFAIQYIENPKNIEKKFFPSREEEKHIRKEWKKQTKIELNKKYISLFSFLFWYL